MYTSCLYTSKSKTAEITIALLTKMKMSRSGSRVAHKYWFNGSKTTATTTKKKKSLSAP